MQLKPEQLREHLKQGLQPLYFIYGDEPLQLRDYTDMVIKAAKYYGYDEIIKFTADPSFDWQQLEREANELSLFSSKKLIAIHMPAGKPGDKGAKVLMNYVNFIAEDRVLLLSAGKLEGSVKRSKWFKELVKSTWQIAVYPMQERQFKFWLQKRFSKEKLSISNAGIDNLYHFCEGNMLAADQEVIKLGLIFNPDQNEMIELSDDKLLNSINNNAVYNIFDLFDCCLKGNILLVNDMLSQFKADGTALPLILSLIAKELRMMASLSARLSKMSIQEVMKSEYIFHHRQNLIQRIIENTTIAWEQYLLEIAHIEKVSKGIDDKKGLTISPWNQLNSLLNKIAQESST